MKFAAICISTFIGLSLSASAQTDNETRTIPVGVGVSNASLQRHGDFMNVDLSLDLSKLRVESNRAVLLTPSIVNGTDTMRLPAIGIYGRVRYYQYQRNNPGMISGPDETSHPLFREARQPALYPDPPLCRLDERFVGLSQPLRFRMLPQTPCISSLRRPLRLLRLFLAEMGLSPSAGQ